MNQTPATVARALEIVLANCKMDRETEASLKYQLAAQRSRIGGEPTEICTWPQGACLCAKTRDEKPDPHGRVWKHCESGLSLSKASMGRFLLFCLSHNVKLGDVYAFDPGHPRSQVLAAVLIRPGDVDAFTKATGGVLRDPPKINLN